MTIAGNFIIAFQQEQRIGHTSSETEQHLEYELRKLGGDAPNTTLAEIQDAEIDPVLSDRRRRSGGSWASLDGPRRVRAGGGIVTR